MVDQPRQRVKARAPHDEARPPVAVAGAGQGASRVASARGRGRWLQGDDGVRVSGVLIKDGSGLGGGKGSVGAGDAKGGQGGGNTPAGFAGPFRLVGPVGPAPARRHDGLESGGGVGVTATGGAKE